MEKTAPEMAPTAAPRTNPLSVSWPIKAPVMAPNKVPTAENKWLPPWISMSKQTKEHIFLLLLWFYYPRKTKFGIDSQCVRPYANHFHRHKYSTQIHQINYGKSLKRQKRKKWKKHKMICFTENLKIITKLTKGRIMKNLNLMFHKYEGKENTP